MQGALLGPSFTVEQVIERLIAYDPQFHQFDEEELLQTVAHAITEDKVVGWFQGRMEFGPRALGARSILGNAASSKTQKKMNLKIKYRESFRPFAPSVLEEKSGEYFEQNPSSPYMLITSPVAKKQYLAEMGLNSESKKGFSRLENIKTTIPAVTHVDGSARLQTVSSKTNHRYYELIKKVGELSGTYLVVNTSFNVRGEPIVCFPEDAYMCFMGTEMDLLVIENLVFIKQEQPHYEDREKWNRPFPAD
ncbi:MAG: carbamoyltransferase C-terminal domain-containing protein [Bdellovibrionales bacterium]